MLSVAHHSVMVSPLGTWFSGIGLLRLCAGEDRKQNATPSAIARCERLSQPLSGFTRQAYFRRPPQSLCPVLGTRASPTFRSGLAPGFTGTGMKPCLVKAHSKYNDVRAISRRLQTASNEK
jgi:hypothetical protein